VTNAWPGVLSPKASTAVNQLPARIAEVVFDLLQLAARAPWSYAPWDADDEEGGTNMRVATLGDIAVVYWINDVNRPHLYVMSVQWLGGL
jgi:hypothetical protein